MRRYNRVQTLAGSILILSVMVGSIYAYRSRGALNDRLVHAVEMGDSIEVERLLQAGADAKSTIRVTTPPRSFLGWVQNLLHPPAPAREETCLEFALKNHTADRQFKPFKEIALNLIRHGASANAILGRLNSPLTVSADLPRLRVEIAAELIAHGGDVNWRNADASTALMSACDNDDVELVRLLLAHNADPNVPDEYGQVALFKLDLRRKNSKAILDALASHGANINAQDNQGKTTLHEYCSYLATTDNSQALLRHLLSLGAKPNARDSYGATPLMRTSSTSSAEILLQAGCDINARDENGNTALILAASGGEPDMVQFLISEGANLNFRDKSGRTALGTALISAHSQQTTLNGRYSQNYEEIVRLLRASGAKK